MKTVIHKATDRGMQDHGWLKAAHSFSFGSYNDPSKVHFGLLRVLNDDLIDGGRGFGAHPHDNMEIVTIPLKGVLAHKDSLGSEGTIKPGEVQIMSAGKGIRHSEYNGSENDQTNLLQIWVFPKVRNIEPRYDQKSFDLTSTTNNFITVVSPEDNDNSLWINQDAYFSLGKFNNVSITYNVRHKGNGAYIFIIEGEAEIDGVKLDKRDAIGVFDTEEIAINIPDKAYILVIDVPME